MTFTMQRKNVPQRESERCDEATLSNKRVNNHFKLILKAFDLSTYLECRIVFLVAMSSVAYKF